MAFILVVEDNPDSGLLAEKILTHYGHEVKLAQSGQTGIEAYSSKKPDLIFLDITLPDMTGQEVAKQINADVPVIALTAHPASQLKEEVLKNGFQDFLEKPFHPNELIGMVKKHIPGGA